MTPSVAVPRGISPRGPASRLTRNQSLANRQKIVGSIAGRTMACQTNWPVMPVRPRMARMPVSAGPKSAVDPLHSGNMEDAIPGSPKSQVSGEFRFGEIPAN
jgi:hypothetical protein